MTIEASSTVEAPKRKLSRWKLFSNALGQLPSSAMGAVQGGFLLVYYKTVIGLSSTFVFWAMTIFAVYNAASSPIIGFLVDRNMKFTRKHGRRFPWIVISIIPWSLSVLFIFWVPRSFDASINPWPVFWWLMATLFFHDTFGTLRGINVGAVRPELFRTEEERRVYSKYYTPIDIFAVVMGMLLPPLLLGSVTDQRAAYKITGAIIAGIALLFSVLSLPGFKEDKEIIDRYFSVEAKERAPFFKNMGDALKLRSFIVFFVFATCYGVTLALIVPNLNFLTIFVLQADYGKLLIILMVYLGLTLVSVPFWLYYTKKAKNSKKVFVVAGLIFSIALIPLTFFVGYWDLLVYTAILGFANGGISALTSTILFPNVVDDFAATTGNNQKAILFGLNGLLARLTGSIDEGIFAFFHKITGFNEGLANYTELLLDVGFHGIPLVQLGIRLVMGVVPALILGIGTFAVWKWFPLTPNRIKENQEKLKQLNL